VIGRKSRGCDSKAEDDGEDGAHVFIIAECAGLRNVAMDTFEIIS